MLALVASAVAGPVWAGTNAAAEPALAGVAVGDVDTVEGDIGSHQVFFTVRLAAPVATTVTVDYATVNGTARAGSDYDATAGRLRFAPGEVSKAVAVTVRHDPINEVDEETFFLELRDATNTTISDGNGRAVIRDEERNPFVLAGHVTVPEGDGGDQTVRVPVRLDQPAHLPVSVDYATTGGNATAGGDYTATSGTLTFGPGEVAKTIDVVVRSDTVEEASETIRIDLTNPVRAYVGVGFGGPAHTQILIVDDDEPTVPDPLGPAVTVAIGGVFAREGDYGPQIVYVPVRLSAPSSETITVEYATSDGRATAPGDYDAAAGTLVFAPGEVGKAIPVTVHGDRMLESESQFGKQRQSERFRVDLVDATGATITSGHTRIRIFERLEPKRPRVQVASATVHEGDQGRQAVTLAVFPDAPLQFDQTFMLRTSSFDGEADADTDYVRAAQTFTFTPQTAPTTFVVRVLSDLEDEFDERIFVDREDVPSGARFRVATINVLDGRRLGLTTVGGNA